MSDILRKQVVVNSIVTSYLDVETDKIELPILVFLHGWGSKAESFESQLKFFKDLGYRSIAIDLIGFGLTQPSDNVLNLDDYINHVESTLKKLKIDNYILVGHSFGGRIAIKGIAKGKLIPKKLVLTGAAGVSDYKPGAISGVLSSIASILRKAPLLKGVVEKLGSKVASDDYVNLSRTDKQTFQNIVGEDLLVYLNLIAIPTLLIWGKDDQAIPIKDAELMSHNIKGSNLVILPSASHYAFIDQVNEFNNHVKSFLSPS